MLVCEYFDGPSLSSWLRGCGGAGFGVAEVLYIGWRVASVLAELHGQQILHRDLTASNVLYSKTTGQVMIIDFGLATFIAQGEGGGGGGGAGGVGGGAGRRPHQLMGTLAYLSPEADRARVEVGGPPLRPLLLRCPAVPAGVRPPALHLHRHAGAHPRHHRQTPHTPLHRQPQRPSYPLLHCHEAAGQARGRSVPERAGGEGGSGEVHQSCASGERVRAEGGERGGVGRGRSGGEARGGGG